MADVTYDDEPCPKRRGPFGIAGRHERLEDDRCRYCGANLERRILTNLSKAEWDALTFLLWEIEQGRRKR